LGATHADATVASAPAAPERKPVSPQDIPSLAQFLHTSSLLTELDIIYGAEDKKERYDKIRSEISDRRKTIIEALTSMMKAAIDNQGPSGGDIKAATIVRRCSRETWLGLELTLIDSLFS